MNFLQRRVKPLARGGILLGLVLAGSIAAAQEKGAQEKAVKPSVEKKLQMPEVPYRYGDLELPAHFKTSAAKRFDNTPSDNPVTDAGRPLDGSEYVHV